MLNMHSLPQIASLYIPACGVQIISRAWWKTYVCKPYGPSRSIWRSKRSGQKQCHNYLAMRTGCIFRDWIARATSGKQFSRVVFFLFSSQICFSFFSTAARVTKICVVAFCNYRLKNESSFERVAALTGEFSRVHEKSAGPATRRMRRTLVS